MSAETELLIWLNRKEKNILDNLKFGIKTIKSAEFVFPSKYNVIINWFSINFIEIITEDLSDDFETIQKFLELKYPIGLVSHSHCSVFVNNFLKFAEENKHNFKSRKFTELLFLLSKHDIFKNVNKEKHILFCNLFKVIFKLYKNYLKSGSNLKVLSMQEKIFFDEIFKFIIEYIKIIPEIYIDTFALTFSETTLTILIEATLLLKECCGLNYFNSILQIQKILFHDYEKHIFDIYNHLPVHAHLLNLEFSLINFRGNVIFYETFIKKSFLFIDKFTEPKEHLMIFMYILELLKKYEVTLKFEIDSECAYKYIAKRIEKSCLDHIDCNIKEVMRVLCCAINLNPLILENSICKLAVQIFTHPLSFEYFENYNHFIETLFTMFKKLNRPEKFIFQLLKSLNEYLKENKLLKKLKTKRKASVDNNFNKKFKSEGNFVSNENQKNYIAFTYVEILLKEFEKFRNKLTDKTCSENIYGTKSSCLFKRENNVFSKFISTLVSQPSLTIWKTLLFDMQKDLETIKDQWKNKQADDEDDDSETILFKLEFISSYMSQYFAGSKLVDHYEKFAIQIEKNITFTKEILKEFGKFLLNIEHNNRIVSCFLEIVQKYGTFCLISLYYPSKNEKDSKNLNNYKIIYEFLSPDEWILIEQRIANFGDKNTKYIFNKLSLQKLNTKLLAQNMLIQKINIKAILSPSTLADTDQIIKIFEDKNNLWLIENLVETDKRLICSIFLDKIFKNEKNIEILKLLMKDYDCIKIICISFYEYFGKAFKTKKAVLKNLDFQKYKLLKFEEKLQEIISVIECTPNKTIKDLASLEIEQKLKIFDYFNIGCCELDFKTEIFFLQLALYRDLSNSSNETLTKFAYNILEDILYFKPYIKIFNYISFTSLIEFVPPSNSKTFYELLFKSISAKDEEYSKQIILSSIHYLAEDSNLKENQIKLILILIEVIEKINNKKFKTYQIQLLGIFEKYFLKNMEIIQKSQGEQKNFVIESFAAFPSYLKYNLGKAKENKIEITEDFRKLCKIYIGFSIEYSNKHSIRLISISLNNREVLHFDDDEIQLILKKYWQLIKEKTKIYKEISNDENCWVEIMKLIVDNSNNTEFRNLLLDIGENVSEENIKSTCRIIQQISKLQMSEIKCAILNEYFKKIIIFIIFQLEKDINQQFLNFNIVITLVNTMKTMCENRSIPLSIDHIDTILSFLMDINIKNFILLDNNEKIFKDLLDEMAELCIILMKSRHEALSDRIPHFVSVYQDLLQAVCWYKCERQKDFTLKENDLQDLGQLAGKLENIMHVLAKDELNLKRVAPYLLTFVINLMVSDNRSTTLYSKIKTHIESICYSLIKICDHRVKPFILRCSNDASRHIFENLVKEFEKYHKFKGKV